MRPAGFGRRTGPDPGLQGGADRYRAQHARAHHHVGACVAQQARQLADECVRGLFVEQRKIRLRLLVEVFAVGAVAPGWP